MDTEWYVPSAMNRKLANYPAFAAVARVKSVSTCDDARTLMTAYQTYAQAHPGFDADQPMEDAPIVIDGIDDGAPDPGDSSLDPVLDVQVPKISGGAPSGNFAIVQTDFRWSPGYADCPSSVPYCDIHCAGTFIAKNFVITAAHCTATARLTKRPPNGQTVWSFAYANSVGVPFTSFTSGKAIQTIDSRFMGWAGHANKVFSAPFDFALVYIPKEDDNKIPVQLSGSPATMGIAMNSSLGEICSSGEDIWAWGPPSNNLTFMDTQGLCQGFVDRFTPGQIEVHFPTTNADGTPYTGPVICQGDSGGALVDDVPIFLDPSQTATGSQTAVVAVVSGLDNNPPESWDLESGMTCAVAGGGLFLSVTYPEVSFVEKTMRKWYGTLFSCDRYVGTSGAPGVAVCQLDPCATDDDCCAQSDLSPSGTGQRDCSGTTRWYCDHPGSRLRGCQACFDGTCNCVQGMCLPAPRPTPGN